VTTAERTSTSEDAAEDVDLDEGNLWGFLRIDDAGGELEMVVWANLRGMSRGVADRKESSEARRVGSVVDGEVEGGKNVECRALAVPPGMRAMRRLGNDTSRLERALCSAFTIS
jgi:hypothetical protein